MFRAFNELVDFLTATLPPSYSNRRQSTRAAAGPLQQHVYLSPFSLYSFPSESILQEEQSSHFSSFKLSLHAHYSKKKN